MVDERKRATPMSLCWMGVKEMALYGRYSTVEDGTRVDTSVHFSLDQGNGLLSPCIHGVFVCIKTCVIL